MFPGWLGCSDQDAYIGIDSGIMQERDITRKKYSKKNSSLDKMYRKIAILYSLVVKNTTSFCPGQNLKKREEMLKNR